MSWHADNMVRIEGLFNLMHGSIVQALMQPRSFNAVFVWGRAEGEYGPGINGDVLQFAAALHHLTGANMYIPDYVGSEVGQSNAGYPGPEAWKKILVNFGVRRESIFGTPAPGNNTKTEFHGLIEIAKLKKMRRVLAVTTPLHALRAMLGAVKSLDDSVLSDDLCVVPMWPEEYDFNCLVYGSQGTGPFTRQDWIVQEFDRIPRYTSQGDLTTLNRLRDYLTAILAQLQTSALPVADSLIAHLRHLP